MIEYIKAMSNSVLITRASDGLFDMGYAFTASQKDKFRCSGLNEDVQRKAGR